MESSIIDELVIVKRSGQRVSFNGTKIAIAIKKAFDSVYDDYNEENVNKVYSDVLKYIISNYSDRKTINVEDIQDIIENTLKQNNFIEVYYSFNNYRLKRRASRELFDRKQQHKFVRATEKLVLKAQDEMHSNPTEQLLSFGKTISEEFSKAYLLDSKYVRSHDEGIIYIHDLDYYVLGTTKSSHLDLSYITDYNNYFDKIIESLLNFKKEEYGEHSITSIDYLFEPYVLYKFREIFKLKLNYFLNIEGFIDLISIKALENVIDKIDNIYIDLKIFDKYMLNKKLSMIFEMTYNYTIAELNKNIKDEITKLLTVLNNMDISINPNIGYSVSLGTNKSDMGTFINKIVLSIIGELDRLDNVSVIYKISDNEDILNMVSALILNDKYILIANTNATFNRSEITNNYKNEIEYFSTGERIKENVIDKNQISVGRMLLSETSINLVRIAFRTNNIKEFYNDLSNTMELVKNELLQTFEYKSNKYKENFKYLFLNNILLDSEKLENGGRIRKVIKNGTLNICYSGLKEVLHILTNKEDLTLDELKLGTEIVKFMNEKCYSYTNEHKLNFVLKEEYEENVLGYFLSIDKSIYGNIKGITDKDNYYTFYRAFDKNILISDRFKVTSKLEKYSSGGYLDVIHIPKNSSCKKVIDLINNMKEYNLGFLKIVVGKV